jgi:hypothetical protein
MAVRQRPVGRFRRPRRVSSRIFESSAHVTGNADDPHARAPEILGQAVFDAADRMAVALRAFYDKVDHIRRWLGMPRIRVAGSSRGKSR